MRLEFIPLDKLAIGRTNMRHGRKVPDVSDILPTVRKRGVLQTLLVRPNPCPEAVEGSALGMFEIVAGRRRYHAARIVADERRAACGENAAADADPQIEILPCAILDDGDDADAIEASMIENMARLDADEVTRWETFTRLVREGRTVEDIALTFGLPDLTIRRTLALGNLLPRIRGLYSAEKIDAVTVRHLTLATKAQQKDWLALVDSEDARAPTGHQLKAWLFGGQSIAVKHALFDVEASGLAIIADLFGEDCYFADSDAFWTAQDAVIEERRAAFLADGWSDVVIVPPGEHFSSWEHEKAGKRKGGRVYIDVRPTGEVVIHEGYVGRKEAARAARGGGEAASVTPARPEVTATMQTYIDLHRHAAVRAALAGHPSVALRLMVAHAIGGSHLWRVQPEPQAAPNDAVRESVETCLGETRFDERRRAVLALLNFSPDEPTVTGGNGDEFGVVGVFRRLLELNDAAVMEVIAIVMGETLASGTAAVDAVAAQVGVEMARYWCADEAFLDLIRDKEVLVGMIGEVAGAEVAKANAGEKTKAMKAIVADSLAGTNGRTKVENWVPRWLAFPPSAYTERGGVGSVRAHAKAMAALAPPEEERAEGDAGASPEGPEPQAEDGVEVPGPQADEEPAPLAA